MPTAAGAPLARVLRRAPGIVNMRLEPLIVVLVCLAVGSPAVLHAKSGPHLPRLRALHPDLKEVMRAGCNGSATFRALVDRLEASDVVVYVEYADLPAGLLGQMTFISAVAGFRYVLVQVRRDLEQRKMISIVGHELQHAVEVATEPQIVDHQSFAGAYARFGLERSPAGVRGRAFDTAAAIVTGRQVFRELAAHAANVATH